MNDESPAARRHRWARAVRAVRDVDTAAGLLEAFEILIENESAEALPYELAEVEALPDWTYTTLLKHAIERRPAPSFHFDGDTHPKVMGAKDLLAGRKYELIGLLALCVEQAWNLGDSKTVTAMAQLCQSAIVQTIGEAGLLAALEGDDTPGDA